MAIGWFNLRICALGALIACPAVAANGGASGAEPPAAILAQLGRLMFFDHSLSASGKQACATCHDPQYAYGPPPGKAIALGGHDMAQPGTRAVPSLRYLNGVPRFQEKYHFLDGDVGPIGGLMWDGRAGGLREQAQLPLLAANEMANAGPADVARKLSNAAYAAQFRAAFGPDIFKDPRRAFEAGMRALEAFQQVPEQFYPYSSRYDAYARLDHLRVRCNMPIGAVWSLLCSSRERTWCRFPATTRPSATARTRPTARAIAPAARPPTWTTSRRFSPTWAT
jgi:cytochrome c peroxidase